MLKKTHFVFKNLQRLDTERVINGKRLISVKNGEGLLWGFS
jgi:hypothetical protein